LVGLTHLIIPGGESTTVGKLMERFGLGAAVQEAAAQGLAVWGTCMGMIMMARSVKGMEQYTLNLLDIEVERNAFGAQVHSFEDSVQITAYEDPITAVFIRAPIVTDCGPNVEVLGHYKEAIVAVKQARMVGSSFHPELTDDDRFLQYFLTL
jgi:pyridoxal 5'-phosphate synthase pdxT subunit